MLALIVGLLTFVGVNAASLMSFAGVPQEVDRRERYKGFEYTGIDTCYAAPLLCPHTGKPTGKYKYIQG
jgi:hypothetical protein